MYLKTKKRYRPGYRERRTFNLRWLWLWIVAPLVVYGGVQIYENRAALAPPIQRMLEGAINDAQSGMATMNAPTPMPTENPTDRLIRAENAWQRGSIGRALEEYAAAQASTPNDPLVFTRMAMAHIIEGRNADALAAAEDAVTADPFSADAWSVRALALARNNRPAEAVASARQALALRPDDATALAFLAEAYRIADETSLALETAAAAIEADPQSYAGYYIRALTNYYSGIDYLAAREDFRIARELAPNLPFIPTEWAWLEWSLDNTDVSMDMLQEVIENNPENLDALYALGYFWYQTYGDAEQSLEYLERCTTADPENIACLNYKGTVQTVLGDFTAALVSYQRLLETGTQDPRYYLRAGNAYINVGDCNGALPVLRTGYELELASDAPNADRIAAFESYLSDCQPSFVPLTEPTALPEGEITEEAAGG